MTQPTARILIDTERTISPISPLLFGGFVEHMGRCVYEGIYDPSSPHADEYGLRTDVLAVLREVGYTTIRYPGGNFLSGYHWQDGVGPQNQRPRRRDLAWRSIESNQFGTNEFIRFCRAINAEPMLGVNLGTGTIEEASNLVEYCNAPVGSSYANLRAEHGFREPHNVRYWCLGNEMDGPWQIGHFTALDYAKKAREAAKMMKWQDTTIKLVLCGSSNNNMPTYPEWDRIALEHCWDQIDYLSLHYYARNYEDDTASYLAYAQTFEQHVDTMAATLRYVKSMRRSNHDVYLSWDEWNVWYKDTSGNGQWQEAPHLSEEVYNLEDALVVAQWLNVFLRKCDVLKIACLAQIVNTISPLLTTRTGILKHATFYPLLLVSQNARGNSLDLQVDGPYHATKRYGEVSLLDVAASHNPEDGRGAFFILNRSQTETVQTELVWQSHVPTTITDIQQISGGDVKQSNTWEQPQNIVPRTIVGSQIEGGKHTLQLPPLSFTVLRCDYPRE